MTIGNLCALSVMACGFAAAADWTPVDVKTGEWEATTTQQVSGMPQIPQRILDKMSPEQRAKMEAAFKAQNGKTTTRRYCVKKEDLSKPLFDNDTNNCKQTLVSGTGRQREIHIECDNPSGKFDGTVRFEALNSENVRITTQVKMNGKAGNSMNMGSTVDAKWVSATCSGKE